MIFSDSLVAATKSAATFTKWKMYVKTYPLSRITFRETLGDVFFHSLSEKSALFQGTVG